MNQTSIDRRNFLRLLGMTVLGAANACTATRIASTPAAAMTAIPAVPSTPTETPMSSEPSQAAEATNSKKRVLRIAHMTDFHAQPEAVARDGIARALRHVQAQQDPPDLILNTGDSVFDSLETDKPKVQAEWKTLRAILDSECKLPIIHALGNHDVWGWGIADGSLRSDPQYGKEMALENLSLKNRYYSFDRAGWHFVVLDSVHLRNSASKLPYIGQLDDEQFEWFIKDVESVRGSTNTPICIISHIPILAACEYFDGPNEESGNWVVPASWMHIDARKFRDLFVQKPKVRLCLSGHTHQYESLDYLGVRYITSGAICGNWWRGTYMDFPPAYVMVNLYDDGSADSKFVPY